MNQMCGGLPRGHPSRVIPNPTSTAWCIPSRGRTRSASPTRREILGLAAAPGRAGLAQASLAVYREHLTELCQLSGAVHAGANLLR